jgi:transposase
MDSFMACLSHKTSEDEILIKSTKQFSNKSEGFDKLLIWVNKFSVSDIPIVFVMEATGVYYEMLAHELIERGQSVSVQLAKNVKYFMQSHNIKSKTDTIDAQAIEQMGLERKLNLWQPGVLGCVHSNNFAGEEGCFRQKRVS